MALQQGGRITATFHAIPRHTARPPIRQSAQRSGTGWTDHGRATARGIVETTGLG